MVSTIFDFSQIWDNPSHWLSYFSRWLKPPARNRAVWKLIKRKNPLQSSALKHWFSLLNTHPIGGIPQFFQTRPTIKSSFAAKHGNPMSRQRHLDVLSVWLVLKLFFFLKTPYSFYIPILHTMNCHMSYVQCAGGWSFPMNKGLQIIRTPQMTLGWP